MSQTIDPVNQLTFILPVEFVQQYENITPDWGFKGLSEFVCRRTYCRTSEKTGLPEEWYEIVERVVNCNFSMAKYHCISNGLTWNEKAEMEEAKKMYDAIFHFRFTPPGRGLWANTPKLLFEKNLSAALNNCGFVSTQDIDKEYSLPFRWAMEFSMLGVGIGFDVKGHNKLVIQDPIINSTDESNYKPFVTSICQNQTYVDFLEAFKSNYSVDSQDQEIVKKSKANIHKLIDLLSTSICQENVPLEQGSKQNQHTCISDFYPNAKLPNDLELRHFIIHFLDRFNNHEQPNTQEFAKLNYVTYLSNMFLTLQNEILANGRLKEAILKQLIADLKTKPNPDKTVTARDIPMLIQQYKDAVNSMGVKEQFEWLRDGKLYDYTLKSYYDDMCSYVYELLYLWNNFNTDFNVYTIEDTREGWVKATGIALDTYLKKGQKPFLFDYVLIREKGIQLKTFGGLSSGPDPLCDLHLMLRHLLERKKGKLITLTDITDILNYIGKCVVAGNVRRTSEIGLGPPDSEEFLALKDYTKNPHRAKWGWCSNNSVFAEIGMDYKKIADMIKNNGEPGLFYLDLCRAYGRLADPPNYKDCRVAGTNPCSIN